jgi:hypothetical protein
VLNLTHSYPNRFGMREAWGLCAKVKEADSGVWGAG